MINIKIFFVSNLVSKRKRPCPKTCKNKGGHCPKACGKNGFCASYLCVLQGNFRKGKGMLKSCQWQLNNFIVLCVIFFVYLSSSKVIGKGIRILHWLWKILFTKSWPSSVTIPLQKISIIRNKFSSDTFWS